MNMQTVAYCLVSYLLGAIPFGWIITWLVKGVDIRYRASGRTGMSNVIRHAGKKWGIFSGLLDVLKGFAATFWAPVWFGVTQPWLISIGGILAVLGHLYSIFLIEKRRNGEIHLRGGAGGLTAMGAGIGIWPWYILASSMPCLLLLLFVGYASISTAMFNVFGTIAIAIVAATGHISPYYLIFTIGAEILVLISLRPNFKRLRRGDERISSLSLRKQK